MRRVGSLSLDEYPGPTVRVDCPTCSRSGRYSRDRLIEQYGPDIALPDVLVEIAACERRTGFSQRCGARYPDFAR